MTDRPHAATPARLRKAKAEGNTPFSTDLATGLSLMGGILVLAMLAAPGARAVLDLAASQFATAGHRPSQLVVDEDRVVDVVTSLVPLIAAVLFVTWVASGTQRGFRWIPWKPQVERLRPISNLKQLGARIDLAVVGWLKSLALFGIGAALLWREAGNLVALSLLSPWPLVFSLIQIVGRVASLLALSMVALGLLDYLWQYLRWRRQLRMTDDEMRSERREGG